VSAEVDGGCLSTESSREWRGAVSADFNQDGIADLAVIMPTAEVLVLLGTSAGLYRRAAKLEVDSKPTGLHAADLDGDGNVDLVVAYRGRREVRIFRGNGDGTFALTEDVGAKQPGICSLTPREVEVVHLAAEGFTCAEIAVELGISRRTAEAHIVAIRSKLALKHKRELVQRPA